MKKKVIVLFFVSIMMMGMVSCNTNKNDDKDSGSSANSSQSKPDENSKDESSDDTENSNGDSVYVPEDDVEISSKGLAEKLLNEITFQDQLSEIDKNMALLQYNLTEEDVDEVVMYLSTGASAEEIAVFKVKDENIRKVQSAVERRISDKKASFKDYNPAELEKLKDPTMYVKDEYVVLCISNDDKKSRKIIDDYMKQE